MTLQPEQTLSGKTLLTARWVVGHEQGAHSLLEYGEIVIEGDSITFVGYDFPGEVARRIDLGEALIGPGFIDLDALSDLDTTILSFDNQPAWRKGRVWPRSYVDRGPYEMYDPEQLAFQKRFAFSQLIRNGITTALPVASLFYRSWGETTGEFDSAAQAAADLGLRVYLGPAYRTGNQVVEADGRIETEFDEIRGLEGLDQAIDFCRRHEGSHGGLVRTMLAPDRIETCTTGLLQRSVAAANELDVPIRLHCCQSKIEIEIVRRLHDMTPPQWLNSLGFFKARTVLPHGVHAEQGDLEVMRDGGATIVHCPLVMGRHGQILRSFDRYQRIGLKIGLGTDTWPPDMILNMQLGLMFNRVAEQGKATSRAEAFYDAATLGGADALGRPDLGRLLPGAKADIVAIDLGRNLQGPDPIQSLMTGSSGRDVTTVFINGRLVMHQRKIADYAAKDDWLRAQAQYDGLIARYPERTHGHPPVSEIFSSSYPRHSRKL
jgi:cytosine/adenosine deaminase-related metal-dependent hydrolase